MEKVFTEFLHQEFGFETAYHFYLLEKGLKPGMLIVDVPYEKAKKVEESAPEGYETYIKLSEFFRPRGIDRVLAILGLSSKGISAVYITRDNTRVKELESGFNSKMGDSEVVGRFLGYPEEAVEYFATVSDSPAKATEQKVVELIKEGNLSREEAEMLKYVEYVPKASEHRIKKAVERGKRNKQTLESQNGEVYEKILKQIDEYDYPPKVY